MRYDTATAFRRALEERLRARSKGNGARIARDRKRVGFDRFLARLLVTSPDDWLLKGGFALDLRLGERARTTKDIDLAWLASENVILDALIDAAAEGVGDFFTFRVERIDAGGDRLGGVFRFRIAASLAGRPFETFLLDVGAGSEYQRRELILTPNLLEFADIRPVSVPTIPLTLQLAEKLHAYTRVYEGGRVSTRSKDLVDIALIADLFILEASELGRAVQTVFASRATHPAPDRVPAPPDSWRTSYRQMASGVGLPGDLNDGYAAAAALLDPVLGSSGTSGVWNPDTRQWTRASG